MRLFCSKCDDFMDYEKHEPRDGGSLEIKFLCPSCSNAVSMITNAGETQLVTSFGVQLGGRTAEAAPMEQTTSALKEEGSAEPGEFGWDAESLERLDRVTPFARPMAKNAIERYARDNGYGEITIPIMDEAKKVVGH